jgi:hypothetical protein
MGRTAVSTGSEDGPVTFLAFTRRIAEAAAVVAALCLGLAGVLLPVVLTSRHHLDKLPFEKMDGD